MKKPATVKGPTPDYSSTYATKSVTATGKLIDLTNPKPEAISIRDIAEALSKLCRFSGHTSTFYSVAQHCCFVHDLCPLEMRPWALLHDAHEAYIGDVPAPLKNALHAMGGGTVLAAISNDLDKAIATRFCIGWPMPDEFRKRIKHADLVALNTERYVLLAQRAAHHPSWGKGELPLARPAAIKRALRWDQAFDAFMERFEALGLPT